MEPEPFFWKDDWFGNGRLKELLPRLYTISCQKESYVADCGFWNGMDWIWSLHCRRNLF